MPHRVTIVALLTLLSAVLLPGRAGAQHHIGVRAGTGGGYARFLPRQKDREMRLLLGYYPSLGISWKYYSPELGVGGLQADLQYATRGYRELRGKSTAEDGRELFSTEYLRTVTAIELPFFWQSYFYAFDRRLRLYLNAGVYASYMLGSRESLGAFGGKPAWRDYEIDTVRDNPFGWGLAGGVGFSVLLDRFEFFAEGRYAFGFADLMKSNAKYPESSYSQSQLDMVNLSVGFYYRLGRGGILAPPPGTNRPKESWDSIPVGRNRAEPAAGSGSSSPPLRNR